MKKILIVEDDEAMSVALRDGFEFEKYYVTVANDGAEGEKLGAAGPWDLLILDVMLPKKSGIDICKALRAAGNSVPIIMLTARGQEIDKIVGLKTGADDYVTKPFSFMELLARVEAVLRRSTVSGNEDAEVTFGKLRLNFKTYEAWRDEQTIDLSPREFRMIRYFLDHSGEIVSREALLNSVWGYDSTAFTRTVDTHMARLRQKVESVPSDPRHLITIHRVGYKYLP